MDDQRPFNEAVATALHQRLLSKGEFVPYTVERMFDGPVCLCDDFLNGREEYVPAAYIRDALGGQRGSSTYDRYCRYLGRHGADEGAVRRSMSQMIVCDALLANSDRHWRNFGIIRNVDTLEIRPAPCQPPRSLPGSLGLPPNRSGRTLPLSWHLPTHSIGSMHRASMGSSTRRPKSSHKVHGQRQTIASRPSAAVSSAAR